MKTAKDEVRDLLEALPEDVSLEEIQYHLYVRQKIQRGLDAAREGQTISLKDVARRLSSWTEK